MKKLTVMLPGPRGAAFHRSVRKDGEVVRVLTFNAGHGVELTAEEVEAVRDDIGNVLHIAKEIEGKPAVKPDAAATAAFVKETADLKAKSAAKADKVKAAAEVKPATHHETPKPAKADEGKGK